MITIRIYISSRGTNTGPYFRLVALPSGYVIAESILAWTGYSSPFSVPNDTTSVLIENKYQNGNDALCGDTELEVQRLDTTTTTTTTSGSTPTTTTTTTGVVAPTTTTTTSSTSSTTSTTTTGTSSSTSTSTTTTSTTSEPTTTTTTTNEELSVQSITIGRPVGGGSGTIQLCGESPTNGDVTDLATVDTNVFFLSNSVIPADGQKLFSDYACTIDYVRSQDALWAMKTANGLGVFDYYDLYITLSGFVDGYFECDGTTTTTTTQPAPLQNIAIARPASGNPGTIELCGVSPTSELVNLSTLDYNVFFRNVNVVPSNGQQLYSNVECTIPYSPSMDALWAVKSIDAMGVFDYYDFHITISGTAGLTNFFQCT